jgi:hypothetical protein
MTMTRFAGIVKNVAAVRFNQKQTRAEGSGRLAQLVGTA